MVNVLSFCGCAQTYLFWTFCRRMKKSLRSYKEYEYLCKWLTFGVSVDVHRCQACYNFFIRKPEIFGKCEKRACCGHFSEKLNSARVNRNFQKFSDLVHTTIFVGSIITMSMIQHHFCLIIMNQHNNVYISGFYSVLHEINLHSK